MNSATSSPQRIIDNICNNKYDEPALFALLDKEVDDKIKSLIIAEIRRIQRLKGRSLGFGTPSFW